MCSVMKTVGDDRGANDQSLPIKQDVMVPGRVSGRICAIGNTDTTSHPPFLRIHVVVVMVVVVDRALSLTQELLACHEPEVLRMPRMYMFEVGC